MSSFRMIINRTFKTLSPLSNMKNLAEVSKTEQIAFINSFDHLLTDMDGVVWLKYKAFPGANACINTLKQNGKKVHYVSNNSTIPVATITERLNHFGLVTENNDVITPITAIATHLKRIQFDKQIYVIGTNSMIKLLQQDGLKVVEGPQTVEETIPGLLSHISDDENIGAVVTEFDLNLSYIKLQKAAVYLSRKDCLFITGAGDAKIPIGLSTPLIGPHYFSKPLIDISGREPYQLAKPSVHFNQYIVDRFGIKDKSRVLFMGDSVTEDLNFATKCGYKKLLVLTGLTKKEHLSKWEYPEEYKPDYYVESLKVLNEIISNCLQGP